MNHGLKVKGKVIRSESLNIVNLEKRLRPQSPKEKRGGLGGILRSGRDLIVPPQFETLRNLRDNSLKP